jgi:SAM-dependent methyltransferase
MTGNQDPGARIPGETPLELWDAAATRYAAEEGKTLHNPIILPIMNRLIGNVTGATILDAGCGTGWFSTELADRGARVSGIDGSAEMIRIATRKNAHPRVTYKILDCTGNLPFPDKSFDIVVSNMVLMDLEDIDLCIREWARVLRTGGRVIFSLTHPCFFTADWVYGEDGTRKYKAVSAYLPEKSECLEFWGKTMHYHRPLSRYISAFGSAGLWIRALEEPVPGDSGTTDDPEWNPHFRIPSFIVGEAVRCRPSAGESSRDDALKNLVAYTECTHAFVQHGHPSGSR